MNRPFSGEHYQINIGDPIRIVKPYYGRLIPEIEILRDRHRWSDEHTWSTHCLRCFFIGASANRTYYIIGLPMLCKIHKQWQITTRLVQLKHCIGSPMFTTTPGILTNRTHLAQFFETQAPSKHGGCLVFRFSVQEAFKIWLPVALVLQQAQRAPKIERSETGWKTTEMIQFALHSLSPYEIIIILSM